MAGLVSGCLGPAPEDKEYPMFFPAGPVGGCLRPALEDRGNRAFFLFFFFLFSASAFWKPKRDRDPGAREAGRRDW